MVKEDKVFDDISKMISEYKTETLKVNFLMEEVSKELVRLDKENKRLKGTLRNYEVNYDKARDRLIELGEDIDKW